LSSERVRFFDVFLFSIRSTPHSGLAVSQRRRETPRFLHALGVDEDDGRDLRAVARHLRRHRRREGASESAA
jgi:hypothetical protein